MSFLRSFFHQSLVEIWQDTANLCQFLKLCGRTAQIVHWHCPSLVEIGQDGAKLCQFLKCYGRSLSIPSPLVGSTKIDNQLLTKKIWNKHSLSILSNKSQSQRNLSLPFRKISLLIYRYSDPTMNLKFDKRKDNKNNLCERWYIRAYKLEIPPQAHIDLHVRLHIFCKQP